jgi:ligand-binding sensor domain-containing protein/signal transduction histidine kinase
MLKRMPLIWLLAIFLALKWNRAVHSELMRSEDFTIRRWTTDDGLPQNRISGLAQTPDGYIWIGTWFGLVRFDGIRFTVFNRYNTASLRSDEISALTVAPDGALWMGTREGLVRLHDGSWKHFDGRDGLPPGGVWDLAFDQAGTLWISCDEQRVGHFPGKEFTPIHWRYIQEVPSRQLVLLPDGTMSVATPRGLALLPGANKLAYPFHSVLAGSGFQGERIVLKNGEDGIWCASRTNLWHELPTGFSSIWRARTPEVFLDRLFREKNGTLWVGIQNSGLHRFNQLKLEPIKLMEGPRPPSVGPFLEDREGSLWVGTDAGLFQLRRNAIKSITQADGLPDDEVWSVAPGPDKTIYCATRAGPGRIHKWHRPESLKVELFAGTRCITASAFGAVWMNGQSNGEVNLIEFSDPRVKRHWLRNEYVTALYLDREDRLWVGTSHGPHCIAGGKEENLPGLPSSEISFSLEAHDRSMWFGTKRAGLYRWKNGALRRFTVRDGLADDFVIALYEDADGVLWIATANGLSRFFSGQGTDGGRIATVVADAGSSRPEPGKMGPPSFFNFTTRHGLFDNQINHILEDQHGFLWFSSNRGIFRIARAELNAVAAGKRSEVGCAVYGTADGMVSSETNGEHQPAGCKADDGRLWFPTTKGLVVIDPGDLSTNEVSPAVVIEQVKVDKNLIYGEESASSRLRERIRLPPGAARMLEFDYTANSFVAAEKVRFKVILEGHEDNWRLLDSSERKAFYANLRPGNYRFRVKACNNHGIWNERGAEFAFSLAPKFIQTPWFPAVCALSLLAVSGGFAFWRLRWQRRLLLAEQNTTLERERSRIAQDLHDDLGSALTGLALEADVAQKNSGRADGHALKRIASGSRALADRMREVVWAINPKCDSADHLAGFFAHYAEDYLSSAGLRCRFELPTEIEHVSLHSEVRYQLFAAFKEALHNVVRHARACVVAITINVAGGVLRIEVQDDGRGLEPMKLGQNASAGDGLENMRHRLASVGGEAKIEFSEGSGTRVILSISLSSSAQ